MYLFHVLTRYVTLLHQRQNDYSGCTKHENLTYMRYVMEVFLELFTIHFSSTHLLLCYPSSDFSLHLTSLTGFKLNSVEVA